MRRTNISHDVTRLPIDSEIIPLESIFNTTEVPFLSRALNGYDDYLFDDTPKTMEEILTGIRSIMQSRSIAAYIVPSVDAHNVSSILEPVSKNTLSNFFIFTERIHLPARPTA